MHFASKIHYSEHSNAEPLNL